MVEPTRSECFAHSQIAAIEAGRDALFLIKRLWQDFPGLRDGESNIDGADLVNEISYQLGELDDLRLHLRERVHVWCKKHHTCTCGKVWYDEHDCACNDRCPSCDTEIQPDNVEWFTSEHLHE